ncbi:hypothetical protein CYL21_0219 [Plasmodium falciparum NF54]|uniref:Uncharacterized protein n=2 Tax=Plasmodium falciparum TaxID=5833 RepID=O96261_PLAF7|nr:conserved protein, unknown function [Plasmodium falciparum 3D7]KAF4331396.1 hypothetical protein CYL21_0219 [Plasmodium falciparum NF54]PKC46321.1 hypothetical protein CK202_3100 [Plasmodium falciparum NF54]CZT98195.1 conserved protein, unknown function [Plasmodium falciparum 3D7]|eukprot:XP_001349686.1 conserved Plasmodium membrane protein, unknown function [Plasmodium falciparum 3D7]
MDSYIEMKSNVLNKQYDIYKIQNEYDETLSIYSIDDKYSEDDMLNNYEKTSDIEQDYMYQKINTDNLDNSEYEDTNIGIFNYIYEMITKKNEMRKEQMKLTLFSINRCVDFFNDFLFLIKVFYEMKISENSNMLNHNIYKLLFLWLLFLYVTSFFTFYFRKYYIMNLIPEKHHNLFSLFKVFNEIKTMHPKNISVLYFYDRIQRTYIVINKFFEDVPQFLLCLLYITLNGKDKFIIFNMLYSIIYFVINAIYHGLNYPLMGTLNLFFSTYLLDDSFVEYDAAPTNKFFCLYSFFVFFIWSLLALSTKKLVSFFWAPFIYFQFSMLFLISIIFFVFFLYFSFHAKQNFYLNPYYCL